MILTQKCSLSAVLHRCELLLLWRSSTKNREVVVEPINHRHLINVEWISFSTLVQDQRLILWHYRSTSSDLSLLAGRRITSRVLQSFASRDRSQTVGLHLSRDLIHTHILHGLAWWFLRWKWLQLKVRVEWARNLWRRNIWGRDIWRRFADGRWGALEWDESQSQRGVVHAVLLPRKGLFMSLFSSFLKLA